MKEEFSENDRWLTAIHEAGHAVAHLRLHDGVILYGLKICRESGRLGWTSTEHPFPDGNRSFENEVVVLCAGYVTSRRAGEGERRARGGASSDFERAGEIIGDPRLSRLRPYIARAEALMEDEENWAAVLRIAGELCRYSSLSGEHAEMILDVVDNAASERTLAAYEEIIGLRRRGNVVEVLATPARQNGWATVPEREGDAKED